MLDELVGASVPLLAGEESSQVNADSLWGWSSFQWARYGLLAASGLPFPFSILTRFTLDASSVSNSRLVAMAVVCGVPGGSNDGVFEKVDAPGAAELWAGAWRCGHTDGRGGQHNFEARQHVAVRSSLLRRAALSPRRKEQQPWTRRAAWGRCCPCSTSASTSRRDRCPSPPTSSSMPRTSG